MENKDHIQEELHFISALIAGMQKVNVFEIPADYFDGVPGSITGVINETGFMDDVAKYNPALKVPEGYFDQLPGKIIYKIKDTATELVLSPDHFNNKNIFEVPLDYFSKFSAAVVEKIQAAKTEEVSTIWQQINNSNVLETPEAYFENLPSTILQKIKKPSARIIKLSTYNTFFKYAVAAIFIGVVYFTAIKFTSKPVEINNNTIAVLEESIEKGKNMDDKNYNEILNNLSVDAIANYLEKNGTEADVATLTSSIDEKELPSQEDYLADEKTLENFLSDIDTKKINN